MAPAMILVPALRVAGRRFLGRASLTGEPFGATAAAQAGFLTDVVDDEADLDTWVEGVVASLLKSAPGAVAATKALLAELAELPWSEGLAVAQAHVGCSSSPEPRRPKEWTPFSSKRAPSWDATAPDGGPVSAPIRTRLAVTGDEFARQRRAPWRRWSNRYGTLHDQLLAAAARSTSQRHRARGKLMVRERLEALVDPGTPVLELCPLAGLETEDPLGGGVVVALAEVAHTQCLVIANDPTVRGGTTSPTTIKKLLRAMDVAEINRLPLLLLVESGGADLPRQADVFVPGGEQFRRLTQLSAQGIPTICVVFGSSTAGGAYLPGMSDYTVMVEGRARVFLGGPPLVKMATGEDADEEELGGALMHARTSGLCDYLARDEPDALRIARGIVAHLRWPRLGPGPVVPAEPPLYADRGAARCRSRRCAGPFRRTRDPRPRARRLTLRGVQVPVRGAARLRVGVSGRVSHRNCGQQRHPVLRGGTEGRPIHSAVQPQRHAAPLRAEHHRFHGRDPLRTRRDH